VECPQASLGQRILPPSDIGFSTRPLKEPNAGGRENRTNAKYRASSAEGLRVLFLWSFVISEDAYSICQFVNLASERVKAFFIFVPRG
jgi:hypothetical protein